MATVGLRESLQGRSAKKRNTKTRASLSSQCKISTANELIFGRYFEQARPLKDHLKERVT